MLTEDNVGGDIAGEKFWNSQWNKYDIPADLWNIDSTHFRNSVERKLFAQMQAYFVHTLGSTNGKNLLEVGCARSDVLPLFVIKSGFNVWGMDYSEQGCLQAKKIMARERVSGTIVCSDIFDPPNEMHGYFDAIVSFGLVEHFANTEAIVTAMARLLKPGGVMFTHIPNMNGLTGLTQRLLDRVIFDLHIPLHAEQLRVAHAKSGMEVIHCDYFMSTNFGVSNIDSIDRNSLNWRIKRFILTWLTRVSKAVWFVEQRVGELPTSNLFSPYINCVAIKPERPN